jgi:hypothetical protein
VVRAPAAVARTIASAEKAARAVRRFTEVPPMGRSGGNVESSA